MNKQHQQLWLPSRAAFASVFILSTLFSYGAPAQDIRGLEVCTAEKQVERRTSCLQSNIEFLQQSLTKLARETQEKIAAANRELAAAKAEIAVLRSKLELLSGELAKTKDAVESKAKK